MNEHEKMETKVCMARPYNFVYINLYSLWKLLFFPYFPYSYQEWLFVDRLSTKDVKIICSFSKCMLMNCSTLLAIRLTWAQVHGYKREWFLWSFTPYHSKKKKSFHLIFLGQKYVYMSCFACSPNSVYVTQLKNMSCAFGIFALQAEIPEARC